MSAFTHFVLYRLNTRTLDMEAHRPSLDGVRRFFFFTRQACEDYAYGNDLMHRNSNPEFREEPFPVKLEPSNLDAMTHSDLWALHALLTAFRRRAARELFSTRPRGYVRATELLAAYACNKATAMWCRERGDILAATNYETICDGIYSRLPYFAKW